MKQRSCCFALRLVLFVHLVVRSHRVSSSTFVHTVHSKSCDPSESYFMILNRQLRRTYLVQRTSFPLFGMSKSSSSSPKSSSTSSPRYTNRLVHEKSLYLQQHAHNSVDWWPWGEAAFSRAKTLDRPIMLSVG